MIRTKEFIKKERIRRKRYVRNNPWINHYKNAKARCKFPYATGYNFYGGRGIKFKMVISNFKTLWFKDKAYLMKKPSIDRIDSNGNYVIENCRFIEMAENGRRVINRSQSKPVIQKRLNGEIVNTFKSLSEAGRVTRISFKLISKCALKQRKKTHNFIWEYKNKEQ